MKEVRKFLIAIVLIGLSSSMAYSQCQTWNDSPQKEAAENAHVVYRGMVKGKQAADLAKIDNENFNIAFDNWKKVYDIAPAADGQRPTHFTDGRKLYKAQMESELRMILRKQNMVIWYLNYMTNRPPVIKMKPI